MEKEVVIRKQLISGIFVVLLGFMLALVPAATEVNSYFMLKERYLAPTKKFENESVDRNAYWEFTGGFDGWISGAQLGLGYMRAQDRLADMKAVPVLVNLSSLLLT